MLVIALTLLCVVLGFIWMIVQPMLARTQAWPIIEGLLTPLPYVLAIAVALLFIYAGLFGSPATLRRFGGSLSLLPPSISTPVSRVGFVVSGMLILAVLGFVLFTHSLR
jgi:hypothetical protein